MPRVAVVPDSADPMAESFADLLTASLSKSSDRFELVERGALDKLAAEAEIQQLAADQRPSALAKLAKADGLIIVGRRDSDPGMGRFQLRLSSTGSGLVMRSQCLEAKESELANAAELAAGVLHFPCGALTRANGPPPLVVSLMGLRPAFGMDPALESSLNLAVTQQLAAIPGTAVSERWRVNDLVFERSLAHGSQPELSTGNVMLDGSYTRNQDELILNLRLRHNQSEQGETHELKGSIADIPDLAQRVAATASGGSEKSGKRPAWNTADEARQFAALGHWLFARRLGSDAAQAYESAVALGLKEPDACARRAASYRMCVDPEVTVNLSRTSVDGWDILPKNTFKSKVTTAIRASQCMLEAMSLQAAVTSRGGKLDNIHKLESEYVFALNMKVLQAVCLRREQSLLANEARLLRRLSREISEKYVSMTKCDFTYKIAQQFYAYDTPDQAIGHLREQLRPGNMGIDNIYNGIFLRNRFWGTSSDPRLWRLVDWSSTDNRMGEQAWKQFIAGLLASDKLLEHADGLAFAMQAANNDPEREKVMLDFCSLMEQRMKDLTTPAGQMAFRSFSDCYGPFSVARPSPRAFDERISAILASIFESDAQITPPVVSMLGEFLTDQTVRDKSHPISEILAARLLNAIEGFIHRAKADGRWDRLIDADSKRKLTDFRTRFIPLYPDLEKQRLVMRPSLPGAVPIRAWQPNLNAGGSTGINADHLLATGDSLFVNVPPVGIIRIHEKTKALQEIINLPPDYQDPVDAIAVNESSLLIAIGSRLYSKPLAKGGSWTRIPVPGLAEQDPIAWYLRRIGKEIFIGSKVANPKIEGRRMLTGKFNDGEVTWISTSGRKPALHPFDECDPMDIAFAHICPGGDVRVMLQRHNNGEGHLMNYDSGKELATVYSDGIPCHGGDSPLWMLADYNDKRIRYIAAFDPAKEMPQLVIGVSGTGHAQSKTWKNPSPLYDGTNPCFKLTSLAATVRHGEIWMLAREPDLTGLAIKNNPNDLRLIRMDFAGGNPRVVPLKYDVPKALRETGGKNRSLDLPIINPLSLTVTPSALFFAPAGYELTHWSEGYLSGGDLAPALLYITWDEIDAWLADE